MKFSETAASRVPASFFAIPLGLLAFGIAWQKAVSIWPVPQLIGTTLVVVGALLWALLCLTYLAKWIWQRPAAQAELEHPVQCCFVGLAGVVAMLASIGLSSLLWGVAHALFFLGIAWTIAFALFRTGQLWTGGRSPESTTPILYLPTVAGGFVTASALANFGHVEWGQLAFGAGLFGWLALESVLISRLYTSPALTPALRPSLGIQLAPPAVAAVAYLNVGPGVSDIFVHALIGYALLQAMILVRMFPWLRAAGATPAWWGFSFGAAALPTAAIKLLSIGDRGVLALLAPWLFAAGNGVLVALLLLTGWLVVRGKLIPPVLNPVK